MSLSNNAVDRGSDPTVHTTMTSGTSSSPIGMKPQLDDADDNQEIRSVQSTLSAIFYRTVHNNVGLLLVASAQGFFSLMAVTVKILHSIDPPVSTLQIIVVRMVITYVFCMVYMLFKRVPDPFLGPKGVRLLLLLRGLCGFIGLFGLYYPLNYLSLSDSTVLIFLVPLCTSISGALFLKESFTLTQGIASLFSICGVVLIARPAALFGHPIPPSDFISVYIFRHFLTLEEGGSSQRLVAVSVALIGVLGASGAYTTIRAIGQRAHTLHSMTSFSLLSAVIATIGMLLMGEPFVVPTRLDWVALLIMIGIFGFLAQVLLTMGLQRETAGRGAMAVYTQIVFATIFERLIFKFTPPLLSVIGTVMIIASALYVALTKKVAKPNPVKLENVDEDSLEEGLLERSSLEAPISRHAPGGGPRTNFDDDGEETSALAPRDNAKSFA